MSARADRDLAGLPSIAVSRRRTFDPYRFAAAMAVILLLGTGVSLYVAGVACVVVLDYPRIIGGLAIVAAWGFCIAAGEVDARNPYRKDGRCAHEV